LFFFVVWERILAVAVGVVAAAVFVVVVSDRGGEGEAGVFERLGVEEGVIVACLGLLDMVFGICGLHCNGIGMDSRYCGIGGDYIRFFLVMVQGYGVGIGSN
jgi:hypothetical protein